MDIKNITKIFIVVSIVVIILFDMYVFMDGGTKATISWTMFTWAHSYPIFPFSMGVIMGHLFWQMDARKKLSN